jgi:hypothetical protein
MLRIILMRDHMNAVDDMDNLVGFSTADDCCAHGGWFVSDKIETNADAWDGLEMDGDRAYPEYHLDASFFEALKEDDDSGGAVVFRLASYGPDKDLYLHLFNCHNGYYGKGFSYQFKGKLIEGGI